MNPLILKRHIAAGLLLIIPAIAFSQNVNDPLEKKARTHHEVPDQPYLPGVHGTPGKPGASVKGTGFTMVQVNVDANGNNIPGDAANEPSLTMNPLNPNKIAIGWRQFDNVNSNFRQAGWAYSHDGGLNWNFPGVIEPGVFRSDPVLDCDSSGDFFYNSLTSDGFNYYCKVFKSVNGGNTWNTGTNAHGGDKQWMTIDRTAGIGSGNIYASWNSYYSSCLPGFFTRSTDGGGYFENCTIVDGYPFWGTMAVGNDGELYIVGSGSYSLIVAKSTNAKDPGSTPAWDFVTTVDLDGYLASQVSINPVGLVGQASIGVDHSNGPGRGNVYVLASVVRYSTGDSADVMFSRSTDGGLTWSSPYRINNDPGTTNFQWFGTMSVAPNGRIDVIWLDTRDGSPGSYMSSLYYTFSLDQGVTWSGNEKLSASFNPHIGWPQQNKMGDYFDMKSSETSAHLAWANTFNGEEDVYYSVITPDITGIADGTTSDKSYFLTASPVPFSDQTTISYRIPVECMVTLAVYDVYGKEVRTLVSKKQPAGSYSVSLDAGDLPAGYYIVRHNAGSHSETLKLIRVAKN